MSTLLSHTLLLCMRSTGRADTVVTMRLLSVLVVAITACGRSGFGTADASNDSSLDPFDVPAGAIVVTFGETPEATFQGVTADTYVISESTQSTYNFGSSTTLSLESSEKRALLRFDLGAIPPGKTIAAARLHSWTAYVETGTAMVIISQVSEAWTEGTQAGTPGVANWTQRTATENWTTPGAGSPGSSGASIGSAQVAAGAYGVDLQTAIVQGWVDDPSTNFGAVMTASGGDLRISSSTATTSSERPELVVTYFP